MSPIPSGFRHGTYRGYSVELRLKRRGRLYEPYQVDCSRDVYNFMRPLSDESSEFLYQVNFDTKHRITGVYLVNKRGCDSSEADTKEIFKAALMSNSPAFALVHNHPSGNVEPSRQDKHMVELVNQATTILDLAFLDSLIIGDWSYYSFAEEGMKRRETIPETLSRK
jgi:DNA repair protein RadC